MFGFGLQYASIKVLGKKELSENCIWISYTTQISHHFFSLASLDQPLVMPGGWILAQQRRAANKQHHKLPPHKIHSLPTICRCCSGHSMPGSISIKWFVLLHQSATITYLSLYLANCCMQTALLQFQKPLHRPQPSSKNNTGDPTDNHIIREESSFSLSNR